MREVLEKAMPRGNLILSTTDFFFDGTPYENIEAFAAAGRDFGVYAADELVRATDPGRPGERSDRPTRRLSAWRVGRLTRAVSSLATGRGSRPGRPGLSSGSSIVILTNQVALVTGASRGIGRAIGLALAAEGAAVVLTARDVDGLDSARAEIERNGGTCVTVVADLADRGAARAVFDVAIAELGRIDILVNNAGIGSSADPRPVVDYDDAFWELTLYLNLTVPYLLSKYAVGPMIERRHGRIIQIASIAGKIGTVLRSGLLREQARPARADPLPGHRDRRAGRHGQCHLPRPGEHADERQAHRLPRAGASASRSPSSRRR